MHSAWLRNTKNKEERRKEFNSYKNAFDALLEILDREETKASVRDYGPGWAEKQIAVNEWNAAINHVKSLIQDSKEK